MEHEFWSVWGERAAVAGLYFGWALWLALFVGAVIAAVEGIA